MIEELEGANFGPVELFTDRRMVRDYCSATGDDPDRWRKAAPPSLAGSLIFAVTPRLLEDPRAIESARSVIHGDQGFVWHHPIPVESSLSVSGTVNKVRERGGIAFVSFEARVREGSKEIVSSSSTFLMSGDTPPVPGGGEEPEPAATFGSDLGPMGAVESVDGPLAPVNRSASRADLVRYAAASGDFNPIHWDHESAVAAGLPGVVVHGLFQTAWLCQYAARFGGGDRPLASAKFRYRKPLRPAESARITGEVSGRKIVVSLDGSDGTVVQGTLELP